MIHIEIRPTWDRYFISMADVAATRGTCNRKQVGAVIVKDRQVLATGYNGAIAGMSNCTSYDWLDTSSESNIVDWGVGHDMQDGHCVRTVHAIMNALAQAAKHGVGIDKSTVYTTAAPCWDCFRVCVNAGVVRFVFKEAYRLDYNKDRIEAVVKQLSISVEQLK